MSKYIERLLDKTIVTNECWEFVGARDSSGYGNMKYEGRSIGAHKISYMLFVEEIPEGMSVLHSCDNPACINPEHLFVGTQHDNIHDMITKGRRVKARQKLSEIDVLEIKDLLSCGPYSRNELASLYGVSYQTIWAIDTHLIWGDDP